MPINQISQQVNAIVMALAGADRIFKLLDETPETDDGYVTLVMQNTKAINLLKQKKRQESGHGNIFTRQTEH